VLKTARGQKEIFIRLHHPPPLNIFKRKKKKTAKKEKRKPFIKAVNGGAVKVFAKKILPEPINYFL